MERYRFQSLRQDKDIAIAILMYLVPGLILTFLFQLLPIIMALIYSFQKVNLMNNTARWVGLANYLSILQDGEFLESIVITIKYWGMRVPLQVIVGFFLALLISKPHSWTATIRTIILVPVVTSMVVATSVLGLMFHPSNGLVNAILSMFHIPPQGFLTDPSQALWTIALITIWKNCGMTMLFFLAGLMSISDNLFEAADIDGANSLQKTRFITIPMLKTTFTFVFLLTTIRSFQVFGPILLTTAGGPSGATRVVVMNIYDEAFNYNQIGISSAESVLLACILILISVAQRVLRRKEV